MYPIRCSAGLATEQGAVLRKEYSSSHWDRRLKVLTDRVVRRQAHLWLRPLLTSALADPFSTESVGTRPISSCEPPLGDPP